jgi:putative spermidine/putrescine transport system ATP-binding protein/spermidine/putrescine transport system ATP-binding protein
MPAERVAPLAGNVVALPTRQDVAVRLEGIVKRFGDTVALQDVQLPIRRGELMTLLGPSGCGKTTLLNLVAGFLVPDSGEIAIDGERVTDVPPHKRQIGMMFQSYALFPHMDVAANVGYGLRMRRLARDEIAHRVADALALVKLTGLKDRRPRQLSGGQQQRVALARALIVRPKVLLLDEPFSALDKSLRASMQVEVKEIQRKLGVTTIFVTHDQSEARLDRVEGASSIIALGAARIAVPSETLGGLAAGAPVDLFVRPEQLRVAEAGEPIATEGIVAAHVYQGGHVDLHVDIPEVASGRLLMRLAGGDAMARWPVGTRLAIAVSGADAVAFPR